MNSSNLKAILRMAVQSIGTKAHADCKKAGLNANVAWYAANKRLSTEPQDKVFAVKWTFPTEEGERRWRSAPYSVELTPWASALLDKAKAADQVNEDAARTCYVSFHYGTSDHDESRVEVPVAKKDVYVKLREKFDAMRLRLLLADDTKAASMYDAFMAIVAKL